ncbi:MAG: Gfo/Idh/MocA family oxidoreductase [Oligosphaeraceae bacterium]|nr:Gfo/Idh/MocA family oxidoreductase [Oligosphaeraceae bacterium]
MNQLRVGFIGCGGIAQYHFGHFEKMTEKARIVACCDILEERRLAAAERFGAKAYADYKQMLEQEKLDVLFVCVHPGAHDGMEFLAIEKGIHLFVQKPMTLDLDYARKVNKAIKDKGLISAVGLQCRYVDSLPFVKNWLDHQELGTISCYRFDVMPMVWWWREMKHSGGQVVEQTIHNFDICRYFFGEVEQVQVLRRRGLIKDVEKYDVDDASSTLMLFKSGLIGTFTTGCFGYFPGDFNVFANKGAKLEYSLDGSYKITSPNMSIEGKAANDYGQECDETFVDAVRGEISADEILSPYEDACKSLALTLAINKSMDQGGMPVKAAF